MTSAGPVALASIVVRRAGLSDYAAFCRLFPELRVDDPLPSREVWAAALAPSTWMAAHGPNVLGYCYVQELADCGYVRNVVVDPAARGRGVGRALMATVAERLRADGKTSWRLNVKPDNEPALGLYRGLGLQMQYTAKALRLPWTAAASLPPGEAVVRDAEPARDAALEALFALPRGQLAGARHGGRLILEAVTSPTGASVGLAVFSPSYPGAFPFRVKELTALAPLLAAMRPQVRSDYVQLVTEDDERLAALLVGAGAILRDELLHLSGRL